MSHDYYFILHAVSTFQCVALFSPVGHKWHQDRYVEHFLFHVGNVHLLSSIQAVVWSTVFLTPTFKSEDLSELRRCSLTSITLISLWHFPHISLLNIQSMF